MAKIKGEVLEYTKGVASVDIFFPNNEVACKWCYLFLRYEENFKRYSCRLTEEWIPDPFRMIGGKCPLIIEVLKNE